MAPPHRQLKNIRNPTPRPSGAFFISRASCNASVGGGIPDAPFTALLVPSVGGGVPDAPFTALLVPSVGGGVPDAPLTALLVTLRRGGVLPRPFHRTPCHPP